MRNRRYTDYLVIVRQTKICKFHNANITVAVGRFRKHHALNCGRSRCCLCSNPRRRFGHVTLHELRADQAFKYDMQFV